MVTGTVQGDSTFSVPGATGCGPNGDGSLDSLVNNLRPACPRRRVSTTSCCWTPRRRLALPAHGQDGCQWSADWHTGFGGIAPTSTTTTTTSTTTTTMMSSPSAAFID